MVSVVSVLGNIGQLIHRSIPLQSPERREDNSLKVTTTQHTDGASNFGSIGKQKLKAIVERSVRTEEV